MHQMFNRQPLVNIWCHREGQVLRPDDLDWPSGEHLV